VEIHRSADETRNDKDYQAKTLLVTRLSRLVFLTLVALIVYACFTHGQLIEMRKATVAGPKSADTAANEFQASQRPWVKIKHRITSPLTFNVERNGGPTAIMTLEDTLENVGPSVAVNVLNWEDVIALDTNSLNPDTARARQKEYLC
jgi:hypothetical protein